MDDKFVNGPLNLIRLEGTINNQNKILYIFFDMHIDIKFQLNCPYNGCLNVVQYIIKSLNEGDSGKTFDIFCETWKTDLELTTFYKKRYIEEIIDFLKKYKKQNVRYHYIDIRSIIKKKFNMYFDIVFNIIDNYFSNKITLQIYNDFVENLNNIKNEIDYLKKSFLSNNNESDHSYIIKKINFKYSNNAIRTKLNELFEFVNYGLSKANENIDGILQLLEENKNFLLRKKSKLIKKNIFGIVFYTYSRNYNHLLNLQISIDNIITDINLVVMLSLQTLVDIYFLRRFLDKTYITNGIVYTGAAHSSTYIYTLVKYFNFKITNASHINEKIENVEILLRKSSMKNIPSHLFFPSIPTQCINIEKFPKGFE